MILVKKILIVVISSIFTGGAFLMCMTSDKNEKTLIDGDSENCKGINPRSTFIIPDKEIVLSNTFIIPEGELSQTIMNALQGNPDDAFRVMLHFKTGLINRTEGERWATIGAENGHFEAQYVLANFLLNFSDDYDSEVRGIFWLYQMAKSDYRETIDWLQDFGLTLETANPPDDSHFGDDFSQFSGTVLEEYKTGALQGNKKAALVLGKYFEEIRKDPDSFKYWYRIGAQNGSTECQYKLGQIMCEEEDKYDQIRGVYWLNRAKENR